MPRKDGLPPRLYSKRAFIAWPQLSALLLVALGAALAALCPWPAGITLAPFCGVLALVCWIEVRRASRAARLAAECRSLLGPYVPALPAVVSQLREAASQLEGAVLQACDGFHGIGVKARAVVGDDAELEREITRIQVALQFQDIVNQRLEHAIHTLTDLEENLGACLKQMPIDPDAQSRLDAQSHRVYIRATERRLPSRHGGAAKSSNKESKDNIEIFVSEGGL
jgi:hypothetical protein